MKILLYATSFVLFFYGRMQADERCLYSFGGCVNMMDKVRTTALIMV